ncbi:MAG: amino acid permease [Candidatus Adiutrix sp.]|jgi:L-asparagine transporter-like permease|nr:amino acid permease [Candidatus Adiutrix sp.]
MSEINQEHVGELKRGLKNRHIQLIALGGAVGTGLFLGAGGAIFAAGPSVLLGYAIAGFLAFMIIRQLGDMVAEEPVAGSFSFFAYKYWGDFPGFLSGWNYWILYVLVGISELTAAAAYMQYWWPGMPTWVTATVFFVIINLINMATVKAYGEAEFWFAIIKVATICVMIVIGLYILLFNSGLVEGSTFKNLWQTPTLGEHMGDPAYSGFMPNGINGLLIALPIIMFAFGGLELVGMTAAEADDPKKVIPMACNQVIWRILIFYIGVMGVLLSLYHWSNMSPDQSPFVMVFDKIGFKAAAGFINFVVLTAALSVYNSCVYANSRMLYGLALQGNAPKVFLKTDKRGVPMMAMTVAGVLTFLVVPLNYFVPAVHDAFGMAMSVVVAALVINWAMISLAHLYFRKTKDSEGHKTVFPSPWFPASNYLCVLWVLFVLWAMYAKLGMKAAVIAVPVWVVIVFLGYKLLKRQPAK